MVTYFSDGVRFFRGTGARLIQIFSLGTLATVACLGMVACSPAERGVAPAGEDSALRSIVPGKTDLVRVNSLYIAPVAVARGVAIGEGEEANFHRLLVESFVAESGIDIGSEVAVAAGKAAPSRANADATLYTQITQYARNTSSALGASKAAAFAATFSAVRKSDGREIWSSSYFSTEHPNSVNLIEVTKRLERDKGTQLPSVEVLLRQAARSAAVDFSSRRVAQFIKK